MICEEKFPVPLFLTPSIFKLAFLFEHNFLGFHYFLLEIVAFERSRHGAIANTKEHHPTLSEHRDILGQKLK